MDEKAVGHRKATITLNLRRYQIIAYKTNMPCKLHISTYRARAELI